MLSGPYLVVLFIGAVVVIVDGQLILRNSPTYLAEVYRAGSARRISMLVGVFFHLVMLGVVAIVASIGLGPNPGVQSVMARVGVILLLTALGHAATMTILSRMRQEQEGTDLAEAQVAAQRSSSQAPDEHAESESDTTPAKPRTSTDAPVEVERSSPRHETPASRDAL
ncbi:MAG: hypothetical protein QOF38_1741 [Pseudonocardiales bacterium]|nr:hypothetical protein [Pseudonocardiales bacterium]MDT7657026.1 hypothetical protein [Pseudonocardiales bacterium]